MTTSNHGRHAAVKAASGIAAVLAVCEAARLASQTLGPMAGAAVIVAVFAACWIVSRIRPLLHPAPRPRPAPGRDPEMAHPVILAGTAASR